MERRDLWMERLERMLSFSRSIAGAMLFHLQRNESGSRFELGCSWRSSAGLKLSRETRAQTCWSSSPGSRSLSFMLLLFFVGLFIHFLHGWGRLSLPHRLHHHERNNSFSRLKLNCILISVKNHAGSVNESARAKRQESHSTRLHHRTSPKKNFFVIVFVLFNFLLVKAPQRILRDSRGQRLRHPRESKNELSRRVMTLSENSMLRVFSRTRILEKLVFF